MNRHRFPATVCLAVLALAGCSSPSPSPSPTTPATAPAPSATGEDCAGATAAVKAALAGSSEVTEVVVIGQCTLARITTSLSSVQESSAQAAALCEKASTAAYAAQDVTSVSVRSASGDELAIGIKGASCIAS